MLKILIPFDPAIPSLGKVERSGKVEMTDAKLFPAASVILMETRNSLNSQQQKFGYLIMVGP